MGLRAFDVTRWSNFDDKFVSSKEEDKVQSCTGSQSSSLHQHSESCVHDSMIHTIIIRRNVPVDLKKVTQWMGSLLWPDTVNSEDARQAPVVFRGKGVLCIQDVTATTAASYLPVRYILQSVHEQFDIQPAEGFGSLWKSEEGDETTQSKIIMINYLILIKLGSE
jgi:hypothetical protein